MSYTILLYIHSWMRYVVVILLLFSILKAFTSWKGRAVYSKSNDKLFLFAFISTHLQLTLGLILYLLSPTVEAGLSDIGNAMRNSGIRFWLVEHVFGMLVGTGLVTFGRVRAKKSAVDTKKYKNIALFYSFGLLLILLSIPWPFMSVVRPLFRF